MVIWMQTSSHSLWLGLNVWEGNTHNIGQEDEIDTPTKHGELRILDSI